MALCNPMNPLSCVADMVSQTAELAQQSMGSMFATWAKDAATWVIENTIGWWLDVDSLDPGALRLGVVSGYATALALCILTIAVTYQGIVLMTKKSADPLISIGRAGLIWLLTQATIVGLVSGAVKGADVLAREILHPAASGPASSALIDFATLDAIKSPIIVALFGFVAMGAGLVQLVLMMFRDGAIAILLAVVMVAAAGQAFDAGRPWLRRVTAWLLTLILYKPVAAMIYAVGLEASASGSTAGPQGTIVGITWMVIAVVALPAMFKFFSWSYDQTSSAYHGGGGLSRGLMTAASTARGGQQQGQSSAQGQAARMATPGGSAPGSGSAPRPAGSGGSGGSANPYSPPKPGSSAASAAGRGGGGGAGAAAAKAAPAFAVAGVVAGAASSGLRRVSAAGGEGSGA